MIGEMKQRIKFEQLNVVPDGFGGGIESWEHIFSLWGKVKPLRSSNLLQDNQTTLKDTFKIIVRRFSKYYIHNNMRVKIRDKYYGIQGVVEVNFGKRFYEITVQGDDQTLENHVETIQGLEDGEGNIISDSKGILQANS